MTYNEFLDTYWAHYISLEKEFRETVHYVAIDVDNFKTFSVKYAKLLLEIGSEVDVVAKIYCKLLDDNFVGSRIDQYRKCICKKEERFCSQEIEVLNMGLVIKPWDSWTSAPHPSNPVWWNVYNKTKHERVVIGTIGDERKEYYKFANQKHTLEALGGLYQLLMFFSLPFEEARTSLLPGSRMFSINGDMWKDIHVNNSDLAIWITVEDMMLHIDQSRFPY